MLLMKIDTPPRENAHAQLPLAIINRANVRHPMTVKTVKSVFFRCLTKAPLVTLGMRVLPGRAVYLHYNDLVASEPWSWSFLSLVILVLFLLS